MARSRDTDGSDKPVRKQSTVGSVDGASFRGYINLQLNEAEKAAWASMYSSGDLWDILDASVTLGVQYSLKRDLKSGGYMASATQRDPGSPNAGLCVTARGKTATIAFSRVLFSVGVLDRTERWEDTQPLADPDRW